VPREISQEFIEAFETKLIETTTGAWEFWFGLLLDYKAEFGDCLVPQKFVYQGANLGIWVTSQRKKKERLTPERIKRLNDLGFVWDPLTQQWERHFKALAGYKAEFGDCLVPQTFVYEGIQLGTWVANQRSKKETLTPERIQRLNDLGFVWDALTQQWEEHFKALVAYKAEFGDCLVPKTFVYRGLQLGRWVSIQRRAQDKLIRERRQRLNDLGFVWDANIYTWEKNFEALVAYKAEFGDCLVPQKFIYRGLKLGSWVNIQRGIKDKLTPERRQRLNDLGFVWDPLTHQWEKNFKALVAYKAEFGDCLVPKTLIYRGLNLGSWVNTLRSVKDKLTPERRQRLNDLGFVWDIKAYYWEKNFEALVAYKAEFGDCLVPQKFIYLGLKLGIWVSTQRSKKETLTPERIQRLNDLGFAWTARE
jgi:DNA-binding TFAR19-related protein (PDSD5 family)